MSKPAFETPKQLETAIQTYREKITASGDPPTIGALASHLGIDRRTLYEYRHKDRFAPMLKEVVNWIIGELETLAIKSKTPAGVIFILKNYGYTDRQEVITGITDDTTDEEKRIRLSELSRKYGITAL